MKHNPLNFTFNKLKAPLGNSKVNSKLPKIFINENMTLSSTDITSIKSPEKRKRYWKNKKIKSAEVIILKKKKMQKTEIIQNKILGKEKMTLA